MTPKTESEELGNYSKQLFEFILTRQRDSESIAVYAFRLLVKADDEIKRLKKQ